MDLEGRVVVVTGAASGIGRAIAERCAQVGARHVVCVDLDADNAAETARLIGEAASSCALDVADEQAMEQLVDDVERTHGDIDLFVSNAGYIQRGGLDLLTEDWQRMMSVHCWAHLSIARILVPRMVSRGGGYLLNTASAAGLLTQIDSGPYAVSKHAAVGFAEWLAINYFEQGLRVSVLCPQAVRTNIISDMERDGSAGQAAQDGVLEPEAVADACIEAIHEERFLVLPHAEVETYFQRKASDYDRWLSGMRRFKARLKVSEEG